MKFQVNHNQFQIMKRRLFRIVVALAATLSSQRALAQSAAIAWHAFGSGGGASTGGVYSVRSTVAQSTGAGSAASGPYSAVSGFGALYVLQSTNAPRLTISRTTTNTVMISWPSPSTGWTLRQTTDVKTGSWVSPAESVSDDGAVKFIVVSPPTGNRYYRLVKP